MKKINKIGDRAIATSTKEPKEFAPVGISLEINELNIFGLPKDAYSLTAVLFLEIRIKIVMVIIGPIEAIPTRPKLSLVEFLPPLTVAMPTPKDKINGTVAEPVVTPPLSKINGRNACLSASGDNVINIINKKVIK